MDRDTAIGYAEMKGREEGIEQGIEQGSYDKAVETARRMLEKKFSINDIAEITNLSPNKIIGLGNKK
jgi:predicted transposase/invertase (TIGR01784 family)